LLRNQVLKALLKGRGHRLPARQVLLDRSPVAGDAG
jgi:hypothetical protein